MIDIDLIREKPEVVEESARRRGQVFQVTEAAELDIRRRRTTAPRRFRRDVQYASCRRVTLH